MVRQIHLQALRECPDKTWLGAWPKREDIDELIHEDVDVYLPSGELAIVFRVGALKSTLPVEDGGTLTPDALKYWRWVSKALRTDQRGFAAGRDIVSNPEIRLTVGQSEFFSKATRAKSPLIDAEEALAVLRADENPSRNTYYVGRAEEDGLVDLEEVERWDSICRKKNVESSTRTEAVANRNTAKLAWFWKWFEESWIAANPEDRPSVAKAARKRYVTTQPRSNMCYSNVIGTINRSGRLPYGRLTVTTLKKWDEFVAQRDFYREVNDIFRETHTDKFNFLNETFKQVKDERYNLFGTAFTTITVNNNFDVAYHRDGTNAIGGQAALCVMEIGDWKGGEFVFPELGIGFDIRKGDIFIGDNQGLIHGMLPFREQTPGAENIMFVFYSKQDLLWMDDLDCEMCRKGFMEYVLQNHPERGEGKGAKWTGSYAGMWQSPEWVAYKELTGMERCSDTNYHGTGDDE